MTAPTIDTADSDVRERTLFEQAIWAYYADLKSKGWSHPEEGDFAPEALFWRHPSGKYGVNQIEAAWNGWKLRKLTAESSEPVRYEFQSADGTWHPFIDAQHYENTVADGRWPIRALYTHPSPTDLRAEFLRGLEDAKKIASNYGPSRPIVTKTPSQRIVGRWEGEQAASAGIADAIEALKGKQ